MVHKTYRSIFWYGVHPFEPTLEHFEGRKPLSHILVHLFVAWPFASRSPYDIPSGQFTTFAHWVLHTDDCSVDDIGMREQNTFELWRSDLESADFDQLLSQALAALH